MEKIQTDAMDLETLLGVMERLAERRDDGHFTIYRFTTGWKVVLGTPDMARSDRAQLSALASSPTLCDALIKVIL